MLHSGCIHILGKTNTETEEMEKLLNAATKQQQGDFLQSVGSLTCKLLQQSGLFVVNVQHTAVKCAERFTDGGVVLMRSPTN